MYPVKLGLKNFLSFKEQEYIFVNGKATLIQGVNLTKSESQQSNGSGKSSLQSAMEYCLTQTTSRKCRDIKLIRRGEDSAFIYCEIYCPVRKETLYIERNIPKKGSTTVAVLINENPVELATVQDANNFIIDWLGISKEDIWNYFIINKERYSSFFSSSNTKKIELISRFSDSSKLNGIERFVDVDLEVIDGELNGCEDEIIGIQAKIETYQSLIDKEDENHFQTQKTEKIDSLNSKILLLKENNSKLEEQILSYTQTIDNRKESLKTIDINLKQVQEEIKKFNSKNYSEDIEKLNNKSKEVEVLISETKTEKKQVQDEINDIDSSIAKISIQLSGSITCPNCHFEFIPESDKSLEELKNAIEIYREGKENRDVIISEFDTLLSEFNDTVNEYNEELEKLKILQRESDKSYSLKQQNIRTIQDQLHSVNSGIKTLESNIQNFRIDIENNNKKIEGVLIEIENVSKEKFISKKPEYEKEIELLNNTCEQIKLQFDILSTDRYNINQWNFNFKKFKSFLAQKSLTVLQTKINENLHRMNSNIRIRLEGFKEKADGTLKEEITPIVIDNGEMVEFNELSGGERVRVDQATIITHQEVINETHPYGGLDLLWQDEITEGLDPLGLKLLMKSMPKDKTIFVTTHIQMESMYEDILTVVNENGISKIQ